MTLLALAISVAAGVAFLVPIIAHGCYNAVLLLSSYVATTPT